MECIDDTRRALEIMASYGQHGKAPTSAFQARSDPAVPALLAAGPKVAVAATTAMPGPAGPVRLRVYRAVEDGRPRPALVYLHGGGCVVGNLDSHDPFCRALANGTGHAVVAVDFRSAPEHPFPAALEDCHAAVHFVAEHCLSFGIIPGRLSIAGDGTGGSLAAAVCRLAREQGPALVHQVLLVPLTQWAQDTPSRRELAAATFPSAARLAWFAQQYLPDPLDRWDPRASPGLTADLAGLPPATVITAELDPLRYEGEAFARAMARAGVEVALHRYTGAFHLFWMATRINPHPQESVIGVIQDRLGSSG